MDVSTIKLHKRTKAALDNMMEEKESYDDVIAKLIEQKRNASLKKDLSEGYRQVGMEEQEILDEWEAASGEIRE